MPEMAGNLKALLKNPIYGVVARQVVLPWVLQGLRPAGEALEVGCGTGAMAARLLARYPDLRLVATDYDPDLVAASRKVLEPFGLRATVQQADATALPFGHAVGNGHGHRHEATPEAASRMIRSAEQLEQRLRGLPVSDVRVRRSVGGVAVRFLATRAAAPAVDPV